VQVTIKGQGTYTIAPEDLPLAVTLVLGDDAAEAARAAASPSTAAPAARHARRPG
jgi:hypothetical protein